jgi:N-acetylglutamate synthase-like GNAT family acetyltransferase
MPEPTPQHATVEDLDAVVALAQACGLPTAGISDHFPLGYSVVRIGQPIVAMAGLESYGGIGLLRSLGVAPPQRGLGLGQQLVLDRLRAARERGLSAVYLLTTTAADYFRRLGFRDAPRQGVPAPLAAAPEFASICPTSAACLRFELEYNASDEKNRSGFCTPTS